MLLQKRLIQERVEEDEHTLHLYKVIRHAKAEIQPSHYVF